MQVNNKMIVDKTKAIINNYCKLSNFTFKKEDNIFTICEANRGFMVLSIDFDNEEYHYTVTYFLYENMSKSDEIKY